MPSVTMKPTLGDVLKYEQDRAYCREAGTLLQGQDLLVGTILGARTVDPTAAGVTTAAVAGNTGNGTLTKDGSAPVGAGAQAGIYRVVFVAATEFVVLRPDGTLLGNGPVATAFDSEVKFNTAAGGTAWAAGDAFTITVPEGDKKLVACPNTSNTGAHLPVGMLLASVYAVGADAKVVYLARGPAMLSKAQIAWDASVDNDAKKAAKLALLAKQGIVARETA